MISVCIPTHQMENAVSFLERSFAILEAQTYKDFEVIISDNSDNDDILNVCNLNTKLKIRYFRNPIKGMAPNTNNAIKQARGRIIKLLYLDDRLSDERALERIATHFKGGWMATACIHDSNGQLINEHKASYNDDIYRGNNTIGSPSVIVIENDNPLLFDETMTWLLDCDYYKRLHDRYGPPKIQDKIGVIIGLGSHQMTNILTKEQKMNEFNYISKKYENN